MSFGSFGATVFGEHGGCRPADDRIAEAKAFGATVLGAACGIAPALPDTILGDTAFAPHDERKAMYDEAYEALDALLVLASKQQWPTDMPVIAMLKAYGAGTAEQRQNRRAAEQENVRIRKILCDAQEQFDLDTNHFYMHAWGPLCTLRGAVTLGAIDAAYAELTQAITTARAVAEGEKIERSRFQRRRDKAAAAMQARRVELGLDLDAEGFIDEAERSFYIDTLYYGGLQLHDEEETQTP